jgi:hypothetical protein
VKNLLLISTALASLVVVGQPSLGQVPLSGKIAYSSLPSPDGGRHWVSLGWNVRLVHESEGWSCSLSSGPMVELVPNDKLRHDIPWQDQHYLYGALIRVARQQTELYAWHKGPAAPDRAAMLQVGVSLKQSGQLRFPIVAHYVNKGVLTMKVDVPRDLLFNVIFPDMENNEMFHLRIDNTAYGLGAMNFRITLPQFRECLQWMDRYDAESK